MSVPILRPLSVGEVLDVSFGLYRAKFATLLLIAVTCRALPIALAIYVQTSGGPFEHLGLLGIMLLASWVCSAIGIGASTFVISDAYLGREMSVRVALVRALGMGGRLIVVLLLTVLSVAMGLFLFIVGAFILLSGLVLSIAVAALEPDVRALAALDRSWKLSEGFRGKVFAAMLVAGLLWLLPSIVTSTVLTITGGLLTFSGALVTAVVGALVQIFVTPFIYVVITVLYYDLRVRKEGLDLEILATTLRPA